MKRPRLLIAALFITAFLGGCYEGWDQGGSGPSGPDRPDVSPPSAKPIAYLLYQPIMLADVAADDVLCFPDQTEREYRLNEFAERIAKAKEGLAGIADKVVTNPIIIAGDDCDTLQAVELMAYASEPWGSEEAPKQDNDGRPIIHLKAAYWHDEPAALPVAAVTRQQWSAWQVLEQEGIAAKSLVYFSLTGTNGGYFSAWRGDAENYLDATAIEPADPTEPGIAARTATIEQDSARLVKWVAEEASSL